MNRQHLKHMFVFDSENKLHELQSQNKIHTRMVRRIRAVVDTSPPRFWVPNKGSPIRVQRQMEDEKKASAREARRQLRRINSGKAIANREADPRKKEEKKKSTRKSSAPAWRPASASPTDLAHEPKEPELFHRPPRRVRSKSRKAQAIREARARAAQEELVLRQANTSRTPVSAAWGDHTRDGGLSPPPLGTTGRDPSSGASVAATANETQHLVVRLEDEAAAQQVLEGADMPPTYSATVKSLVGPQKEQIVQDFVALCLDSEATLSKGKEGRRRLINHTLREVEEQRLLRDYH